MKKTLLIASCLAVAHVTMSAQQLTNGYITKPSSSSLDKYVKAWDGGKGKIQINDKDWEDQEFYTSRVKPRKRFYNTATQVRRDITQWTPDNDAGNDKRYCMWQPIGDEKYNALPNGIWDSEVFSMWSYVDVYSNWSSPFGWTPGAFADIAHKNGVAVSGVASVPWGYNIPDTWSSCFGNLIAQGSDAVGKFLHYFGQDGLGYNSEWGSPGAAAIGLTQLHNELDDYMANTAGNPLWEVMWYAGVGDNGGNYFDTGIARFTQLYQGASLFLNYNWNKTTYIESSIRLSKAAGKNPFYLYAGMDQQGAQPKTGQNYDLLAKYQYSIGMWGAHSANMFWEGRGTGGATTEATQRYYLNETEAWFTGGSRNPAIRQEITTNRNHRSNDTWAGVSALMSARSPLDMKLDKEPFYSYFNLGNGKFFNWQGNRVSENQWYSIAIQDYMPTWRYWFAPSFLQGEVDANSVSLKAEMTWEDAYLGGSCLKVTGSSAKEYLHLFKTNFAVSSSTRIRIIYKLLSGKADLKFALTNDKAEAEFNPQGAIFTLNNSAEKEDASYRKGNQGWQVAEFELPMAASALNGNLSVIALRFENADNLSLLIGGVEVANNSARFATPVTPQVIMSRILNNNFSGVDGKIIWKMADSVDGKPIYNSDVNTSMFKVYAQEEGCTPVFVGATTSWAAIAFRAPNTDISKKIRLGVSAVSLDTKSESEIAWGEYLDKGAYTASEDIEINKTIIKPGESFECRYVDNHHTESKWTICDSEGNIVASNGGISIEVVNGLPVGMYHLYLDKDTDAERFFDSYVQVTPESSGAVPEIYSISHNGLETDADRSAVSINVSDNTELSYTGRNADGASSRAIKMGGRYIGCSIDDLNIGSTNTSISIAGWFKFDDIPTKKWNLLNVSDKSGTWPQNTWGWAWNTGYADGSIDLVFRGATSGSTYGLGELHYNFPKTRLQAGVWTHMAWVFEYAAEGFRCQLYINGVKQESRWYQYASPSTETPRTVNGVTYGYTTDENGNRIGLMMTDDYCASQTYRYTGSDWIYFGGMAHEGASIDGLVDDLQIWKKAMSADDVRRSMSGITTENLPSDVMCLWDFESETASDHGFTAIGNKSEVKAYSYELSGSTSQGNFSIDKYEPNYATGCPFLPGTASPVITTAEWKDTDRKTVFTPKASEKTAGEAGAATVEFVSNGDHNVTLTLKNTYGSSVKEFPVFTVSGASAIDSIEANESDLKGYVIDGILFIEPSVSGDYNVDVYNASGMCMQSSAFNVVAGRRIGITLNNAGVYFVKVTSSGQLVRTLKVIKK